MLAILLVSSSKCALDRESANTREKFWSFDFHVEDDSMVNIEQDWLLQSHISTSTQLSDMGDFTSSRNWIETCCPSEHCSKKG